jgi:hypothetical protein
MKLAGNFIITVLRKTILVFVYDYDFAIIHRNTVGLGTVLFNVMFLGDYRAINDQILYLELKTFREIITKN